MITVQTYPLKWYVRRLETDFDSLRDYLFRISDLVIKGLIYQDWSKANPCTKSNGATDFNSLRLRRIKNSKKKLIEAVVD
jgi:hypothetical protein